MIKTFSKMKATHIIILMLLVTAAFNACKKEDPVIRNESNVLSDIYATKEGSGTNRLFEPRFSNDTIYFDIPYFYPVDSDNETDLTRIILRATIPSDAKISPSLGVPMDLTKPLPVTVTSGSGVEKQYTIVARKVGDVVLRKAEIALTDNGATSKAEGVISNSDVLFYVVPGLDVSHVPVTLSINPHSTASVATGSFIDLRQPVPVIISGIDGSKKTYTLKVVEPVELSYGVGISRLLWKKDASQLTGFTTNDNNRSMAISGNYLILSVSSTPSVFKVYNRQTGDYVQDLALPPGAIRSFAVANDAQGRILVTSWAPKNGVFYVYRYNDPFDTAPLRLINWTNNNPTGLATDAGVGRRVNVYGDLSSAAVITATAGMSNVFYRWYVENGVLKSNTPEAVLYGSIVGANWGYYAEVQPTSANANGDYFVNYTGEIGLVSGASNQRLVGFSNDASVVGTNHGVMDYFSFNHANYLAIVAYQGNVTTRAKMYLFDVTNQARLAWTADNPNFSKFQVFKSSEELTASANGNAAADISIGFSQDKKRVQVYTLLTNGGIMAHEFTTYAP